MKALKKLPDGYREISTIDLQKDKKTAVLVRRRPCHSGAHDFAGLLFCSGFRTF